MTEQAPKAGGIKGLISRLEQGKLAPIVQFVKFGIVGVTNTGISYGIDMLCNYVLFANTGWDQGIKTVVNSAIAFIISVTHSYYWNNRFVFAQGRKTWKEHLASYGKTVACYALTGLIMAPLMKNWMVDRGMAYWLASLLTLVVTIPLNFLMNKFWAFRKKNEEQKEEESK